MGCCAQPNNAEDYTQAESIKIIKAIGGGRGGPYINKNMQQVTLSSKNVIPLYRVCLPVKVQ